MRKVLAHHRRPKERQYEENHLADVASFVRHGPGGTSRRDGAEAKMSVSVGKYASYVQWSSTDHRGKTLAAAGKG